MKNEFFNIDDKDVEAAAHLSEEEINSPVFDPEDFAPAPGALTEEKSDDSAKNRRSAMIFAIIAAVFTLIIAAVGVLGAGKVQDAQNIIRRDKVFAAFDNCSYARYYSTVEGCDVYAVIYKDRLAGYGIYKTVKGFGGDIEVLVCFDSANTISSVRIVSENESDGLGSRIRGKSFLSAFKGGSSENMTEMLDGVDLISGATVSSGAVKNAVSDIIKLGISSFSIAKDLGIETVSQSEIESDTDKNTDDTTDKKTDDTTKAPPSVTTSERPSSNLDGESGGAGNNVTGNGDISVDVSDVTTVYESEGEADDTTDASEPATDTTAEDHSSKETEPPATNEPESTADPDTSTTDSSGPEPVPDDSGEDHREPVDNSQGGMT